MTHLSHAYPSGSSLYLTFVFRLTGDPDESLDRWAAIKRAASDTIVAEGGTISHHHGVGTDHAPYLEAEKGALGMAALASAVRTFDPEGLMNPGVLLAGRRRPMSADRILALDVGTQSVRAMVFDPVGRAARAVEGPDRALCPRPAGLLRAGCRPVLAGARRRVPAAVGDAGGPARRDRGRRAHDPARHDRRDRRGRRAAAPRDGLARPAAGPRGCPGSAAGGGSRSGRRASPTRWRRSWRRPRRTCSRAHEPEMWARVRHYLLLSGFLPHRLTGEFVDSVASQVGYLPFDYKRPRWAGPGDWKWQAAAGPARLAAAARPAGRCAGHDLRRRRRGDRASPPACPSSRPRGTRPARSSARGRSTPHIGAMSLGTTATINTTHRRYVEVIPIVPPYPAAVPGAYSLEVQVYRGYWMIEWFKREFGAAGGRARRGPGRRARDAVRRAASPRPRRARWACPPALLVAGRPGPGPEAKGAVIGWGDVHTRAHLYRAIIEGLAYALREGAERTVKRTACRSRELRVRAAGRRARPRSSSPRTSSACRRRAPTPTRHRGWGGDRRGCRPRAAPVVRGGRGGR